MLEMGTIGMEGCNTPRKKKNEVQLLPHEDVAYYAFQKLKKYYYLK